MNGHCPTQTSRSQARPFPDFRDVHAPVRLPANRLSQHPEQRSANRFLACERAWQSLGTCPVPQLADGDRSVAATQACCRMRHRHLARQGRNRGRLASCAAADHRRWAGCRFLRNHGFSLPVRILPSVIEGGRGFRRRGLYREAKASLLILGERRCQFMVPRPRYRLHFLAEPPGHISLRPILGKLRRGQQSDTNLALLRSS